MQAFRNCKFLYKYMHFPYVKLEFMKFLKIFFIIIWELLFYIKNGVKERYLKF